MADAFRTRWKKKKGNRRLPVVDPSSKNSCPSHWLFSLARPDPRQRVTLPPSTPPLPIPYIPRPIWTRERESMAVNSGWFRTTHSGRAAKAPKSRAGNIWWTAIMMAALDEPKARRAAARPASHSRPREKSRSSWLSVKVVCNREHPPAERVNGQVLGSR